MLLILDDDGIELLKDVLSYNWHSELEDYTEQRLSGETPENLDCHVFTKMARLDALAYEHNMTAEDHYREAVAPDGDGPPFDAATATGMYDREDG